MPAVNEWACMVITIPGSHVHGQNMAYGHVITRKSSLTAVLGVAVNNVPVMRKKAPSKSCLSAIVKQFAYRFLSCMQRHSLEMPLLMVLTVTGIAYLPWVASALVDIGLMIPVCLYRVNAHL